MTKRLKIGAMALLILLSTLLTACDTPEEPDVPTPGEDDFVSGAIFALDTFIEQKWYGPAAQETYDQVCALIYELERDISMHLEGSEIDRLNKAAGHAYVALSERTYQMLYRAKTLSATQDVFDITIAPLVTLWNISTSGIHIPTDDELSAALDLVRADDLLFDEENRSAMLAREGMSIDLGGLAKGWIVDEIRDLAIANGVETGYVSLGGNLMVIGKKPDGSDFLFGIRNPRGYASEYVGTVTLDGLTMATSGDYERFVLVDGERYHHVLDPRTGYPANNGIISVSVISPDGLLADYLSTVFFVEGLEATLGQMESEEYMLVVIDEDHNIYISEKLRDNFNFNEQAEGYRLIN